VFLRTIEGYGTGNLRQQRTQNSFVGLTAKWNLWLQLTDNTVGEKLPSNPSHRKKKSLHFRRFHSTLKRDTGFKKRVSWLEDGSTVAVVEYIGQLPRTQKFSRQQQKIVRGIHSNR
jgi:hypothetical protein